MLYKMREEEFATVYKIMSESFPVDERRTFDEQIGLLTNPLFEILVWKSSLRKRNRQGAGSNFIAETVSIRTNIRIYNRLFPRVRNPFRL